MARRRITWKDRAAGYETPNERFCRHNGIPYRGGCGSLEGKQPAYKAARRAVAQALYDLMKRARLERFLDQEIGLPDG